jgi:hypothetical protein
MSSDDNTHIEISETEQEQMQFMARRLGFDHFIICGYDSAEFRKHVLSKGIYESGSPKFGINATKAGLAYMIAKILCDFDFSEELRVAVHSIINTVLTGREMQENIDSRST